MKEKWKGGFGLVLDHEGHFDLKLARFWAKIFVGPKMVASQFTPDLPLHMMRESPNFISMTMLAGERAFSFGNEVS